MPEFLADGTPVATQDTFVDSLTLGPAPQVRQIILSVLGANAVTIQCWFYTDKQKTKSTLEPFGRTLAGQSVGVVLENCAGVRIKSATAGKSSLVVAELDYESDVKLTGGSVTSATIDASGNVTPQPAAQVNVQHNGTAIGTEATLDFVDETGGLTWTVVDDSGNLRVTITPAGSKPPTQTIISVAGSGTYSPPSDAKAILVECIGGGGAGGGSPVSAGYTSQGGGGSGGGYAAKLITSPAASYAYTVGGGGSGSSGGNGGDGGASSFGAGPDVEAAPGLGGQTSGLIASGSYGFSTAGDRNGSGMIGDIVLPGGSGEGGFTVATTAQKSGAGGPGARGGGGGRGQHSNGANSYAGEGGAGGGGGGGGSLSYGTTEAGGNGGDGLIVITEFY